MRWALLGLVVGACGASSTSALSHHAGPDPEEVRLEPRSVWAPRPPLDLPPDPDPSARVRWPLGQTAHPVLEPSFAIAAELAQPGLEWTDLCRMGVHRRHLAGQPKELTEYLSAWCAVETRNIDDAVARLVPLLRAPVTGMPAAVRLDIANVIVDGGDSDRAQRTLAKARCDEIEVYDLVSASFAEVGRLVDARVFGQMALDGDDARQSAKHCHRLARQLLLDPAQDPMPTLTRLKSFNVDPVCSELENELTCWAHVGSCSGNYDDRGLNNKLATLTDISRRWPTRPVDPTEWIAIAERAETVADLRGAEMVEILAIETALRGLPCPHARVADLQLLAGTMSMHAKHDAFLDKRISVVVDSPGLLCQTDAP